MSPEQQIIADRLNWATAKEKADDLLRRGDEAGAAGNRAESKRLLRDCRRWRRVQQRFAPPLQGDE